jgi:hypothetical protein
MHPRGYIPKNVFFLREEVLIYDAPERLHSQECFFPPRGGFDLRCTEWLDELRKYWLFFPQCQVCRTSAGRGKAAALPVKPLMQPIVAARRLTGQGREGTAR